MDDSHAATQLIAQAKPVDAQGRYLHWDELRRRIPPEGLSTRQWWLGTRLARRMIQLDLPLIDESGAPFCFANVDAVQRLVHLIDQKTSGHILSDDVVTSLRSSTRYLVSSLTEEAITSSQLEGASTTRKVAKRLLATGRAPQTKSEQMIVNNYHGMEFAQSLAAQDLTPVDILELHRILTLDTLDDPNDAGRLQGPGEERIAVQWHDGSLLHRPPPAETLTDRLEAMCAFANSDTPDPFIHPVVRAILLHLWLAYDHPFVDGNGRTARALFYWSMLRRGYWLAQYLSISSILAKAPAKYARSYLMTESDDNDATYFVLFQLSVIDRAIGSLHDYLARKMQESKSLEAHLQGSPGINPRQLAVLRDSLKDPGEPFTIAGQARLHRVAYQSARTDLLGLADLGLLSQTRVGKKYVFRAQSDLPQRLREGSWAR